MTDKWVAYVKEVQHEYKKAGTPITYHQSLFIAKKTWPQVKAGEKPKIDIVEAKDLPPHNTQPRKKLENSEPSKPARGRPSKPKREDSDSEDERRPKKRPSDYTDDDYRKEERREKKRDKRVDTKAHNIPYEKYSPLDGEPRKKAAPRPPQKKREPSSKTGRRSPERDRSSGEYEDWDRPAPRRRPPPRRDDYEDDYDRRPPRRESEYERY